MSLLPRSRVGRKSWPPLKRGPSDPLEWDEMRKGSKKGLVLLLVGLSWWIVQATKKRDKLMATQAVNDVLYAMRQLAAHASKDDTPVLHKRARGQDSMLLPLKRCGCFCN